MKRGRWLAAAGVLSALMLSAAVLGCGGAGKEASSGAVSTSVEDGFGPQDKAASEPMSLEERAAGGYESDEAYAVPETTSSLPQLQLKVIKNALVDLETDKGGYAKLREDAVAAAYAAGGFVENESSSKDDEGYTYATLTLRVPAEKFDEVLSRVSSLGEVVSTQVSTQDVSGEYVDLESRLRHLQAEESFYLALIAKAQTIQEMISIQEHLSSIQLEKEQLQGRKDFLDQQISFSTVTLSVDEVSPEKDGEGFWHRVGEAFRSFGRGMRALAVGIFYALPYLLVLAVIAAVAWLLVRRSRKQT